MCIRDRSTYCPLVGNVEYKTRLCFSSMFLFNQFPFIVKSDPSLFGVSAAKHVCVRSVSYTHLPLGPTSQIHVYLARKMYLEN